MRDDQAKRLFELVEEFARKAQAVFVDAPEEVQHLTDAQRWARLLAHFDAAPGKKLTPEQVSHAAIASGYGDPRGVGALYKPDTGWLKSEGGYRVLAEQGQHWFETEGVQHLGDYEPVNI